MNVSAFLSILCCPQKPCLLGVPKDGGNQNGYITSAFLGFLLWERIKKATLVTPKPMPMGNNTKNICQHNSMVLVACTMQGWGMQGGGGFKGTGYHRQWWGGGG